jgi:hypothetical protein
MFVKSDFLELYETLSTLTEAKSTKTMTQAVQENCTKISELIPELPDVIDGYEIWVGTRFKREYKNFMKSHKDISNRIKEKFITALSTLSGGFPNAEIDIVATGSTKIFYELKLGRFRDRQEARAIYFTEQAKAENKKFFILGSFFIHTDSRLTKNERESAIGTYKSIQNSL